jgi:hypothetical protein
MVKLCCCSKSCFADAASLHHHPTAPASHVQRDPNEWTFERQQDMAVIVGLGLFFTSMIQMMLGAVVPTLGREESRST